MTFMLSSGSAEMRERRQRGNYLLRHGSRQRIGYRARVASEAAYFAKFDRSFRRPVTTSPQAPKRRGARMFGDARRSRQRARFRSREPPLNASETMMRFSKTSATAFALLATTSCGGPPVLCRTVTDCDRLDGKRVQVIGIYRALPHPKGAVRGELEPVMARVDLDGRAGPYLEPFWNKRAARDADEMRKSDGKRVRVTGTYHSLQPRNPADPPNVEAQAMGGACVSDIEELVLAE
jgi:hypothetical protein